MVQQTTAAQNGERGMAILAGIVAVALLMSITIASLLLLSTNRARLGFHQARRLQAQFAAEAGLWWAQQQCRNNPYLNAGAPGFLDGGGDVDLTIGGPGPMAMNVDVQVTNEPALPGVKRIVCLINYAVN